MRENYSNIEKIVSYRAANKEWEKMYTAELVEVFQKIQECSESEFLDIVLADVVAEGSADEVLKQWVSRMTVCETYEDSSYDKKYQTFKNLTTLFQDEAHFYKPTQYIFAKNEEENFPFTYQPPSVSYLPLFVELYKLYGGDFAFQRSDTTGQEQELSHKMKEKLGKLHILELGSGPGFGLHAIRKVVKSAIGLDKERFKEQPKTVSIVQGDAIHADQIKAITQKRYHLIYSLDMIEGEIFANKEDAARVIRSAHNLLAPGGLQAHSIPYKPYSRKVNIIAILMEMADEYSSDIIRVRRARPLREIRHEVQSRLAQSPQLYSRTQILNESDIHALSEELCADVIKYDILNGHFIFALKKSEKSTP